MRLALRGPLYLRRVSNPRRAINPYSLEPRERFRPLSHLSDVKSAVYSLESTGRGARPRLLFTVHRSRVTGAGRSLQSADCRAVAPVAVHCSRVTGSGRSLQSADCGAVAPVAVHCSPFTVHLCGRQNRP